MQRGSQMKSISRDLRRIADALERMSPPPQSIGTKKKKISAHVSPPVSLMPVDDDWGPTTYFDPPTYGLHGGAACVSYR